MWGILIAITSGALMSIQGVWNTQLSRAGSTWLASSYVQLTAFIICILLWLCTGREGTLAGMLGGVPKYMLFTGVAGALITITVIQSIAMISPAKATIFIISTQLFISYLIEVMGLFGMEKVPFQWRKCIGAIIVIAGVVTFKWE